jgi:spore coat protein U-like protein
LILLNGAGSAATATSSMSVTATLVNTCSVSAAALVFPPYTAGGGAQTATTTVKVSCVKGSIFNVGLGFGNTTGSSYSPRLLSSGANTLQYNLYTSNAYSTVWGDGSGSTQYLTGTGNGTANPVPLTVYGLLPDNAANQVAAAGAYSDSILVVIVY